MGEREDHILWKLGVPNSQEFSLAQGLGILLSRDLASVHMKPLGLIAYRYGGICL